MSIGKRRDGTLKKGYRFAKGGRVVKAKVKAKAKRKSRKKRGLARFL